MNTDQLKATFQSLGWNIGVPLSKDTGVSWTAYKRITNAPDCQCNDKPPNVTVTPYNIVFDTNIFHSVEFQLTGELPNGMWFKTEIYGIKYEDVITKLDEIVAILARAWITANI
jgi:hypothetical protein